MPLFGNNDETELGKQMRSLSDQIGALGKQVADKNAEIQNLNRQLAQNKAQREAGLAATEQVQAYQTQVADLQQQLAALQAQAQAAPAQQQGPSSHEVELQQQVAQLQQQLSSMQAQVQAAVVAPPAASAAAMAPAPVQETAETGLHVGGQAWVTREGGLPLRLRSSAGLAPNSVIDRLPPGTQMSLLGGPQDADGYTWWHIRTSDGREGWVAGNDLRTQPD